MSADASNAHTDTCRNASTDVRVLAVPDSTRAAAAVAIAG